MPNGPVVVGGPHLALVICVVLQPHICNLEAELAIIIIAEHCVAWISRYRA